MNKYKTLALILTLPLFLTACSLIPGSKPETKNTDGTATEKKTETNTRASLLDLMKSAIPQKCIFKGTTGDQAYDTTVYVSGDRSRNEFSVKIGEEITQGIMIVDGNTAYYWSPTEASKNGLKMEFNPDQQAENETETERLKEEFDYTCTPWIVNEAMFTVPTDITFFNPAEGLGEYTDESMCATCDSMEGEEKTQCKQALNCN